MKSTEAKEIFKEGYNCAQAVLMAYCDKFGIERSYAARIACGLGGGIARSRETCGAVIGGIMVLGLAFATDKPDSKKKLYEISRAFMEDFKNENGSVICRELLGLNKGGNNGTEPEARTKAYYKSRPCEELVGYAADLLERYLKDE